LKIIISPSAVLLLISFVTFISCNQNQKNSSSHYSNSISLSEDSPVVIKNPETFNNEDTASHKFPKPTGWVNDFENILDNQSKSTLINLIEAHKKKKGNQIAVVTVSNYGSYNSINDYAVDLANEWGIGLKEKNNGVLILFSKQMRQVRVLTGLGMEEKLPDDLCEKIVNEKMLPLFQSMNYGPGLIAGVQEIIRVLEQY